MAPYFPYTCVMIILLVVIRNQLPISIHSPLPINIANSVGFGVPSASAMVFAMKFTIKNFSVLAVYLSHLGMVCPAMASGQNVGCYCVTYYVGS
jgi:hypothetical protein